jgi:hypothetical protein
MLQSLRDQIVTAFCDALKSEGTPCPIFRSLTQPLHRDDSIPGIVVTPATEAIAVGARQNQLRTLTLKVVCVWGSPDTDDETIDQKVEALTSWVESAIRADETFGGLALLAVVKQIAWHVEAIDEDYIGAEMMVEILYCTARNAPNIQG